MAIALFIMIIGAIFLVMVALFITGIVYIVIGTEDKKRGGKGKKRTKGIVMLAIPLFLIAFIAGRNLLNNIRIKCVSDEWRYKPLMSRSTVAGASDMVRELFEYVDDEDEDMIYREFAKNVRDDRHFDDKVDDFFDDIDDLKVDLDPDDFRKNYGKNVHLDVSDSHVAGYIYSAKIDGETYYCYLRVCSGHFGKKDDVGLQQFIICTEDKVDELYKIIEDEDDDIYLEVL